jgi:3-oxoacyl-[acyl-carrier-protein] synthase II
MTAMPMTNGGGGREVWVTGIGLLSSLGEGLEAHWTQLGGDTQLAPSPVIEAARFAPYPVHPMVALDLNRQIPRRSDQRQMEAWQHIGVYAAGLALDDAGIKGDAALSSNTHLVVAAGSGERDTEVDERILELAKACGEGDLPANEILPSALRPTLFLAQLSNLLAGNVSIVHNVTASSRTFMGEEMAGIAAIENAVRRVASGQVAVVLAGGALNAERNDLLLNFELGSMLWSRPYRATWERSDEGGGFVPGSIGAFLVLEARDHAEARGARPHARITGVLSDRSDRTFGAAASSGSRLITRLVRPGDLAGLAVLSGASGVEPVTGDELGLLTSDALGSIRPPIRAYGTALGHGVEAHFPAGVALAALALSKGAFYPPLDAAGIECPTLAKPDRILVTGFGHWRGEGVALLEEIV